MQPHGLQHARLSCPLSSKVCSSSCPLSQWCYLIILSSVALFSFCLQSFPASGSFPTSQLFPSGGQSIGGSAFSPSSEYSGLISFRVDWFDLAIEGTLKSLLQQHNLKASIHTWKFYIYRLKLITFFFLLLKKFCYVAYISVTLWWIMILDGIT